MYKMIDRSDKFRVNTDLGTFRHENDNAVGLSVSLSRRERWRGLRNIGQFVTQSGATPYCRFLTCLVSILSIIPACRHSLSYHLQRLPND